MKTIMPERIFIEKGDRIRYKTIGKKLGKFYHTDIFVLSMIYGYMNNVRIPLKRKEGLFRTISARNDFYSILILLFINEMDECPNSYDDLSKAVDIAQEYANGGLKLLEDDVYNDTDNIFNKLASNTLKSNNPNFLQLFNNLGIE